MRAAYRAMVFVLTMSLMPTPGAQASHGTEPQPTGVITTALVSLNEAGNVANADTGFNGMNMSPLGRFVVFSSTATNLVSGTQSTSAQTYLRDRWFNGMERISQTSAGQPANNPAYAEDLSSDGSRIVFRSASTNLVTPDTNGLQDIFLYDRPTGSHELVTVSTSGVQANALTNEAHISGDGRYVVFPTSASNLDPRLGTGTQVFRRDTDTDETTLLSVSTSGTAGANNSVDHPRISADGSIVVFDSRATNLVASDTSTADVYIWDAGASGLTRILSNSGVAGNGHSSAEAVSADGRYVLYRSDATNMVASDTNALADLYRYDRQTGQSVLVTRKSDGSQISVSVIFSDMSSDGRHVVFDTTGQLAAADTDSSRDVYVRDIDAGTTTLVSLNHLGNNTTGTMGSGVVTTDGQLVAFQSQTKLVDIPGSIGWQIYARGDQGTLPAHVERHGSDLLGVPRHSFFASDPVNTTTGNFIESGVDLAFPEQVFGLSLERFYNSLDTATGVLGAGWTHLFDVSLSEQPDDSVVLRAPDGRRVTFVPDSGAYQRPLEFRGDLAQNPDSTWTVTYDDGTVDTFDATGRLTGRQHPDGPSIALTWTGSQVTLAASSLGYSLTPAYNAAGRLVSLTSSDGRAVTYSYTASGYLEQVQLTGIGQLVRYEHDPAGRITKVRNGADEVTITNTYDSAGRVSGQSTPSGDAVTFSYDTFAGETGVSWASSGQSVIATFDTEGRPETLEDPTGELVERTYDVDGNLLSETQRDGHTLSQTFDSSGNLLSRSLGGSTETWTYDGQDRPLTHTDGEGGVTTYTYEADEVLPSTVTDPEGGVTTFDVVDNRILSIADPDGVTADYVYDSAANLIAQTDGLGNTTAFTYDAAGRLTAVTSPLGHVTSYTYDAAGRRTSQTDPTGATTSYSYDGAGRLTTTTLPNGGTHSRSYNAAGLLQSETDPLGNTTTYTYDTSGRVTSITAPGGAVSSYTYGALDRVSTVTTPATGATTYTYDEEGRVSSEVDILGGTTTSTYDARGRLISEAAPAGTTTYTYDDADRLLTMAEPGGATTTYGYDLAGRQTSEENALGNTWTTAYTDGGRVESTTDPLGNTTTTAYDLAGRRVSEGDPLGNTTTFTYDADGRLIAQKTPAGLTTRFSYDAAGRRTGLIEPDGATTTWAYNSMGHPTSVTDAMGAVQLFGYNLAGWITSATDANGGVTTLAYDGRGNRTSVTDARGNIWAATYDAADRVLTKTDPLGNVTTLTYNVLGRLASQTDGTGDSVTYAYDGAGRLLSRTHSGGLIESFTYDAAGNRITMTDPTGTTTFGYDAARRLTSRTTPDTLVTGYSYDAANRRTGLIYPDGTAVSFGYDAAGRLTSVTHPTAGTASYTYDTEGRLTGATQPGVVREWGYLADELVSYRDQRAGSDRLWQLRRDRAGRIVSQQEGLFTASYTYDLAGQLTRALVVDGGTEILRTYDYDRVGNRTRSTTNGILTELSYDTANRLTQRATPTGAAPATVTTYAYDAAGRRTAETTGSRIVAYGYDDAGRLNAVTTTDGASTWTETREHDADGNLAAVVNTDPAAAVTTTALRWDVTRDIPQPLTITRNGVANNLVHGIDRIWLDNTTGDFPFLHDVYGSALETADTADYVRAERYDPYGAPASADPGRPEFGYRGELSAGALLHLRAREYDWLNGTFTKPDPIDGTPGQPTVANPYPYGGNDPVNMLDPLGLSPMGDDAFKPRQPGLTETFAFSDRPHAGAITLVSSFSNAGPSDYFAGGIVMRWRDFRGRNVVLRHNVLERKLKAKHNTDGATARFVTQQTRGADDGWSTAWDGLFFRHRCLWFICVTQAQLYRAIADFGAYHDGDVKGIVTAYCLPNERCPDWIKKVARESSRPPAS